MNIGTSVHRAKSISFAESESDGFKWIDIHVMTEDGIYRVTVHDLTLDDLRKAMEDAS